MIKGLFTLRYGATSSLALANFMFAVMFHTSLFECASLFKDAYQDWRGSVKSFISAFNIVFLSQIVKGVF